MIISDYTFEKDALFAGINLAGDELAMYHRVHAALAEKFPSRTWWSICGPATETLMQRIAHRDRPYERGMDRDYIDELNQAYEAFFAHPRWEGRLLPIETDTLNIVARPDDLNYVINRIRQTLRIAPYQEQLPWKAESRGIVHITRDLLVKFAREYVAKKTRPSNDIVAVCLTGSVLTEDPLIGGSTIRFSSCAQRESTL